MLQRTPFQRIYKTTIFLLAISLWAMPVQAQDSDTINLQVSFQSRTLRIDPRLVELYSYSPDGAIRRLTIGQGGVSVKSNTLYIKDASGIRGILAKNEKYGSGLYTSILTKQFKKGRVRYTYKELQVNLRGPQDIDRDRYSDYAELITHKTNPLDPKSFPAPESTCGDGVKSGAETCDDGENNGQPGHCNNECTGTVPSASTCGNNIKEGSETCDGSSQVCTVNGYSGNQTCNTQCSGFNTCVTTQRCGDTIVNGPEACDGNSKSCTTANGYAGNQTCNTSCSAFNSCTTTQRCGDGIKNGPEACDDGNTSSNDGCSSACKVEVCGDGVVQPNEQCEGTSIRSCTTGGYAGSQSCITNNCTYSACSPTEYCGDGVLQSTAGEACDDDNSNSNDGCSSTCKVELCGDGIKQTSEQCDDGNSINGDGCSNVCASEFCGDHVLQPNLNEACDSNSRNCTTSSGFAGTQNCNVTCSGFGTCSSSFFCGDGNCTNPPENSTNCPTDCPTACGNGVAETGEQCDDGNLTNGDGCNSFCVREFCGDGIVHTSLGETCDSNSRSCTTSNNYAGTQNCNNACNGFNTCTSTLRCGDGAINGTEVCDGSNLNGKSCSTEGFTTGTLSCNSNCTFNTTSCSNPPPPSGGSIIPKFTCRSFGQTATNGGSLNIKYATPMICWASETTVNGVAVNETGWVPEVSFDWNWDDNSLGSVVRGGIPMDLGKGVGLVTAHAFKPSTFTESCGGRTNNSKHTVTLTVSALVNGQVQTSQTSLDVCVENPQTTWPNPIAYCDDNNCADDSGVPPGTIHGGTNATDLQTILQSCNSGPKRILLEGGVTFTTAGLSSVGANSCLIESYGPGQAKLKFTNTGSAGSAVIRANNAACAGYRLHNLLFAGNGLNLELLDAGANTGCAMLLESDLSQIPGEEFLDLSVIDPPGDVQASEIYWIKTRLNRTVSGVGTTSTYVRCKHCAWVGGELSASRSHTMRLPQWNYVALDAMKMSNIEQTHSADHLMTWRQNCGGSATTGVPCPIDDHAGPGAITRNEFLSNDTATFPMHFCTAGSGNNENTKCFDVDIISNVMRWDAMTGVDQFILLTNGGGPESIVKRFRISGNALDMSAQGSTNSRLATLGMVDDIAFIGNVLSSQGPVGTARQIANGSTGIDVAKNNVCYENGTGSCNMFPALTESLDNMAFTSDPFDGSLGEPGQFANFNFTDLRITSASPLFDRGVLDGTVKDIVGNSRPQGAATDPGIYEAQAGSVPPPPPSAVCGNGVIEGAEACDGSNLNGKSCSTQGFTSGTLSCTSFCTLNTSLCSNPPPPTSSFCGNGVVEGTEQCDSTNLNGKTCVTQGFASGTLTCNASCSLNTSQCTNPPPPPPPPPQTGGTVSDTPVAWDANFNLLPRDAQGWTILTPSSDSRIIYVSDSTGNDSTGVIYSPSSPQVGADPTQPVGTVQPFKTVAAALANARIGFPDWVLFKKGDTWTGIGRINLKSGRSVTERHVIGAYGTGSVRPMFKMNDGVRAWKNAKYAALIGINFYAYTRDPASPNFTGFGATSGSAGLDFYGDDPVEPTHSILIEDSVFDFFASNVITGPSGCSDIIIRRSQFLNNDHDSAHSQGLYAARSSILLEENLFDHNGWYQQSSVGGPSQGQATIFNHNTYFSETHDVIFRRNIFSRSSSIQNKFTANPNTTTDTIETRNVLLDNNFYVDGEIGASIGGNTDNNNGLRFQNMHVMNNVYTDIGKSRPTNRSLGWGLEIKDWDGGKIQGNYLVNYGNAQVTNVYGINLAGNHALNVDISNNVVDRITRLYLTGIGTANQMNVTQSNNDTPVNGPHAYLDATRTLDSYMASQGKPANFAAFLTEVKSQSKSNWRAAYTAPAINAYFRNGYCLTSGSGATASCVP